MMPLRAIPPCRSNHHQGDVPDVKKSLDHLPLRKQSELRHIVDCAHLRLAVEVDGGHSMIWSR